MIFKDRRDAGRQLAQRLPHYAGVPGLLVLGIPRGGVSVAAEIAQELHAPLDIFLSQKLGVPEHEELAFGAITSAGTFLNDHVIREAGISRKTIEAVSETAREKLRSRELLFRSGRAPLDLEGRTVILVDDGVATGASLFAAIDAIRGLGPKKLIAAVPVAPPAACGRIEARVDELVVLHCPPRFFAVGEFYEQFTQVSDEEVAALLAGGSPA